MSKFNQATIRPAHGNGPIVAQAVPTARTFEGAAGYLRDVYSELFLLGVTNMVGENTFYETATARDARFAALVRRVAVDDIDWLTRFVRWLRAEANMRSAPLVAAAHGVHARLAANLHGGNRQLIDAALLRPDEPGEMLAFWHKTFGRSLPKPVKRGIADAALRLYREYSLLKYDTPTKGVRWADVLELTHPGDRRGSRQGGDFLGDWHHDLFVHAIDRRHRRNGPTPETLRMIRANEQLRLFAGEEPGVLLDSERLREAGMTWEDVLSLVGSKVSKAGLWSALIPVMGMTALARNLRNFDQAKVSDDVAQTVMARFTDREQVLKSRMLPFQWLTAYKNAPSLRWGHALEQALQVSLANVPALPGRTLVLVDTSGSMTSTSLSKHSTVSPLDSAALFGVTLAARGERVDLAGFADGVFTHPVGPGASVLREVQTFVNRSGEVGHGTDIAGAVRAAYDGQERVVIVSDMQTCTGHITRPIPSTVPVYGFNLGGYRVGALDAGATNRIEFGGMTDATFRMLPLIEAGRRASWPF